MSGLKNWSTVILDESINDDTSKVTARHCLPGEIYDAVFFEQLVVVTLG